MQVSITQLQTRGLKWPMEGLIAGLETAWLVSWDKAIKLNLCRGTNHKSECFSP